jgi:hypothetical protein
MTGDPAYCRECGSELPPGAKFCAECGEAVPPDIAGEASGTSSRETTPEAATPDAGGSSGPDGGSPEDGFASGDRSGDESPALDDPAADDGGSAAGAGAAVEEGSADDDRATGSSLQGRTVLNCLIGSVIGFVGALILVLPAGPLYFVGVMIGSGVAGWLQRRGPGSGALVGGVAGLLSTLLFAPFAVVLVAVGLGQFVLTGAPLGLLPGMQGELPETQGLLTVLLGIGAVVLAVVALINLVVGAVSGAIGGAIAEE